ncbi:hypothetical protein MANES_01G049345v8 [Manihot esculenta]|nr:hypothetical protein MANES_01G049345v8 [Manihot esculenta]
MNVIKPVVHPMEAPALTDGPLNGPNMRMKDVQHMPGTHNGLTFRLVQFVFGLIFVHVMTSTNDFRS